MSVLNDLLVLHGGVDLVFVLSRLVLELRLLLDGVVHLVVVLDL